MKSRNLVAISGLVLVSAAWGQSLNGVWDATLTSSGNEIPFKLGLSIEGGHVEGWFYNGDDREVSSTGTFENGSLVLTFGSYAAVLRATVQDGHLDGEYTSRGRSQHIHAVPASQHAAVASAPDISGQWWLENVNSSKAGEKAWYLIVKHSEAETSAAILRVDGDTGTLTGTYKDGKFVLGHFDGARPMLLYITPRPDGTLALEIPTQRNSPTIIAYRPEVAKANGMAEPTDADQHTSVKDASKPFPFSFPDLNGNIVSNTDSRFKNKVVLVNITGSWCPNCHDEAPFLASVYNKYHDQGLEIVALSFEEAEQLKDPVRLKEFIAEYGIKYTVLLGGETDTAKDKLTNAANWDAWPTTFFVGRDGLVKYVHAGFAGPGTGDLAKKEKEEFIARVEKLLAEGQTSRR